MLRKNRDGGSGLTGETNIKPATIAAKITLILPSHPSQFVPSGLAQEPRGLSRFAGSDALAA
jgi:hypothetical protein